MEDTLAFWASRMLRGDDSEHDAGPLTGAGSLTGARRTADVRCSALMSSRLRKLSIWLALVAYCLTGVASAKGLVLCLEPDGHLSLEAEAAGCTTCCSAEDEPGSSEQTLAACPCVDVPIGSPDAVQLRVKSADIGAADACLRPSNRTVEPRSTALVRGAGAVPRLFVSSALAQQRTVVLLV